MGGNIGVTVRLSNGFEYRMQRWTNPLPNLFTSIKFFKEDKEWFDDWMNSWRIMKDDYEEHKKDKNKKYRENMTDMYFPWENWLAPVSYGIVVADYKTKTIVSCNDYFEPGLILTDDEQLKYMKMSQPEAYAEYMVLKKQGLIKRLNKYHSTVDMKKLGWKLFKYKNDIQGIKKALKKVEQIGFKLSSEEKRMWKEYITEKIAEREE